MGMAFTDTRKDWRRALGLVGRARDQPAREPGGQMWLGMRAGAGRCLWKQQVRHGPAWPREFLFCGLISLWVFQSPVLKM